MKYGSLVGMYDRLDATSSTRGRTGILAGTFTERRDPLAELTPLPCGRRFAPWEADELGVSSSLTPDAVVTASGVGRERVEHLYEDHRWR